MIVKIVKIVKAIFIRMFYILGRLHLENYSYYKLYLLD